MANTVLTPNMILKGIYAIWHQVSNFIPRTNRQYDNRFANRELKIGQSLDIRLPPKFVTRTGNTMSSQNLVERKVTLPLATIHGIDFTLTQEQLTFDLEDQRIQDILKAATSQLVSTVESTAMATLYKSVANYVGLVTTASTTVYRDFQNCGRYITDNLASLMDRTLCMDTQTRVDVADANKNLFNPQGQLGMAFTQGELGKSIGGFDVYENTLVPTHTSGTFTSAGIAITTSAGAPTPYFDGTGNATSEGPYSIYIDGMSAMALKAGDILTITGVKDVHPESKQAYGYDKRFVVQEDATYAATRLEVKIMPVPIFGGAYANISRAIANNDVVLLPANPATTDPAITYGQNIAFQRDAFVFVTADLVDPSQYGDWGGRLSTDELSIRIWRKGDIVNGTFPYRLDIAWGVVAPYPESAVRWVHAQA